MPVDQAFLDLVNQYIPEGADTAIAYEENQLQNTTNMIAHFEKLLLECDWENEELVKYYRKTIEGYKKRLNEKQVTYSNEQMAVMLEELSKSEIFKSLPIPVAFLEKKAEEDDLAKDELARIRFMQKQVKTQDQSKRLENYKSYLLEKIDRNKLDRKFGKK